MPPKNVRKTQVLTTWTRGLAYWNTVATVFSAVGGWVALIILIFDRCG